MSKDNIGGCKYSEAIHFVTNDGLYYQQAFYKVRTCFYSSG